MCIFFGKIFGTFWGQKRAGDQSKPALVPQKVVFCLLRFPQGFWGWWIVNKGDGWKQGTGKSIGIPDTDILEYICMFQIMRVKSHRKDMRKSRIRKSQNLTLFTWLKELLSWWISPLPVLTLTIVQWVQKFQGGLKLPHLYACFYMPLGEVSGFGCLFGIGWNSARICWLKV